MNIKLSWTDFKSAVANRGINPQWILKGESYFLYAFDSKLAFECKLDKEDASDFETNYKDDWNISLENRDLTGRSITRIAATVKGWHYQAHSIQFEVCKLNSIYNKDASGTDLGFATIKVYNSSGVECTTQVSADLTGVKTVVQWKPGFDFEIISGNVRQATKESFDTYMYVHAKVMTGLAAPYDVLTIPFTQGGVNMKYIGADEPLKTDGRASKLLKGANGDFFEIIANHAAGNHHEMSIIFEIYKDPTS